MKRRIFAFLAIVSLLVTICYAATDVEYKSEEELAEMTPEEIVTYRSTLSNAWHDADEETRDKLEAQADVCDDVFEVKTNSTVDKPYAATGLGKEMLLPSIGYNQKRYVLSAIFPLLPVPLIPTQPYHVNRTGTLMSIILYPPRKSRRMFYYLRCNSLLL